MADPRNIAAQVEQHTEAACEATAHGKHGRAEYEAARADLLDMKAAGATTNATTPTEETP